MTHSFEQVFVVTYGRSGSTLLQRVLNSLEGYLIRGENEATLFKLFQSVKAVENSQTHIAPHQPDGSIAPTSSPSHPWFGIHDIDVAAYARALVDVFVQQVIRPSNDTRVYGFKEIRYLDIPAQLPAFLDFMRVSFSNPAFVFNYRRWEDVMQSGWWKRKDHEELERKLRQFEETAHEFSADHNDRCIGLQYEDYAQDPAGLKPLFDFLGEEFDATRVATIVSERLAH